MSIGLYCRVSTDVQAEANGVDAQRFALNKWASAQGIPPESLSWYIDEGVSGKNMKRPDWMRLQADIDAGKIKTVVVYSLDRIGRCCGATIQWFEAMRDKGVRVVIVKEGWDLSNNMAMLIVSIMAAIAEWQRKDTAEKTSAGIRASIAKGKPWGGAALPLGAKGGPKYGPDLRRKAIARVRAGETPYAVAKDLGMNEMTVKKWAEKAA